MKNLLILAFIIVALPVFSQTRQLPQSNLNLYQRMIETESERRIKIKKNAIKVRETMYKSWFNANITNAFDCAEWLIKYNELLEDAYFIKGLYYYLHDDFCKSYIYANKLKEAGYNETYDILMGTLIDDVLEYDDINEQKE